MRLATTLLAAAAVIALTAPTFAQVTPGGPGERHSGEAPAVNSTQAPAASTTRERAKTTGSGTSQQRKNKKMDGSDPKGTALPQADE